MAVGSSFWVLVGENVGVLLGVNVAVFVRDGVLLGVDVGVLLGVNVAVFVGIGDIEITTSKIDGEGVGEFEIVAEVELVGVTDSVELSQVSNSSQGEQFGDPVHQSGRGQVKVFPLIYVTKYGEIGVKKLFGRLPHNKLFLRSIL